MSRHQQLGAVTQQVLMLLAKGHDTKSIAAELGTSVHSVNERLREARLHFGTTSSREAARIFAAKSDQHGQNSWPKFSDLDASPAEAAGVPHSFWHRSILVSVLFVAAAALAMLWSAGDQRMRAGEPPKVVSTHPKNDEALGPGTHTLKVTFDQPMQDLSFSYVQTDDGVFPDCKFPARLTNSGHTFEVDCSLQSNTQYDVWFNRAPYLNFRSQAGQSATPYRLRFRTR